MLMLLLLLLLRPAKQPLQLDHLQICKCDLNLAVAVVSAGETPNQPADEPNKLFFAHVRTT